jgi:glyoxylase-like metal-dependent hydrolase (beta-lactamase superfamily II)
MTANNCNTYLITGPTNILIDPGHARLFDHVANGLGQLGLGLDDIGLVICTHAHYDHLEAVQFLKRHKALFAIHEQEWESIKSRQETIGLSTPNNLDFFTPDFFLKEGDLKVGDLTLEVLHTPGHSPGSVSIYWPKRKALFAGDLIFQGSIGRTDLPGGNGSEMKESIRRLTKMDIEWVLPGHMGVVSGADTVQKNFKLVEGLFFDYI